jgi:hypothetical protein
VLPKYGFDEANIEFVKSTKIFDITDAIAYIQQRRIELIKPSPELARLFITHYDVVGGSIFPYFSLLDRMNFSLTCKNWNKIARQPIVWKNLCLLHDRARTTSKNFKNILSQYGEFIHSLSIQKCTKLTSESLKLIGKNCPNLRVLNAADNHIFEEQEQTAVFSKLTKLQVINISCNITSPTPKPIGCIQPLKELKELNMAGRPLELHYVITNANLKVLDIRHCVNTEDLRVDCPQLEKLIVDKPHSHPKHTTNRSARRFFSYGTSDPQAFTPIALLAVGPDEYIVGKI